MGIPSSIFNIIANNDARMLSAVLKKITSSSQLRNPEDELFFAQNILTACVKEDASDCINAVINHYTALDELDALDQPKYTMNTRLIESRVLPDSVLENIFEPTDVLFQDICLNVISTDMGANITTLLNRAARIFRLNVDTDTLQNMKVLSEEKGNYMAKGVFKDLIKRESPWTPKPKYMLHEEQGTTNDLVERMFDSRVTDVNVGIPTSARKTIRAKVESMMGIKMSDDPDTRRKYTVMVKAVERTSGPKERAELDQFINTTSDVDTGAIVAGTILFNVLGPVNTFIGPDGDATESTVCKYGCRMLTCQCYNDDDAGFESDEEYGIDEREENSTSWFAGACWTCDSRIPRACYALRRPVDTGGWRGTYCTVRCLETDDGFEPLSMVEQAMVRVVKEQLDTIGIIDREDDVVHPYADTVDELVESDSE